MADEVIEGAVGPSEPAPTTKGANGPAGPTSAKGKAKEAKLPANHELLLSGNVLVTH
jgi:hypothetical protein